MLVSSKWSPFGIHFQLPALTSVHLNLYLNFMLISDPYLKPGFSQIYRILLYFNVTVLDYDDNFLPRWLQYDYVVLLKRWSLFLHSLNVGWPCDLCQPVEYIWNNCVPVLGVDL